MIWHVNDLSGRVIGVRLVAGEAYWAARAALKARQFHGDKISALKAAEPRA